MIYLFTRADGNQTEGIGAVAQCQIHTYTLSKMLGVGFASTKFENLQHYQEYDTQENFSNDVTNFFNFPNQIDALNKSNLGFLDKFCVLRFVCDAPTILAYQFRTLERVAGQELAQNPCRNQRYEPYNRLLEHQTKGHPYGHQLQGKPVEEKDVC